MAIGKLTVNWGWYQRGQIKNYTTELHAAFSPVDTNQNTEQNVNVMAVAGKMCYKKYNKNVVWLNEDILLYCYIVMLDCNF